MLWVWGLGGFPPEKGRDKAPPLAGSCLHTVESAWEKFARLGTWRSGGAWESGARVWVRNTKSGVSSLHTQLPEAGSVLFCLLMLWQVGACGLGGRPCLRWLVSGDGEQLAEAAPFEPPGV